MKASLFRRVLSVFLTVSMVLATIPSIGVVANAATSAAPVLNDESKSIHQSNIYSASRSETLNVDESICIYHTLDLASDISVTFAVLKSAMADYDSYYLECSLPEYQGNELSGTSTVKIDPEDRGNYYYFTLTGITAVRIGDMVDAVLHMTKDGAECISKTDSYSVATYAYAMLNSATDSKMLTLCADLLRYGAAAQNFKGYRTNALADAAMTDEQKIHLSDTEVLNFTTTDRSLGDLEAPTVTWVGKALDLGSKVGMKFVFNTSAYTGDIANLSMKVFYEGTSGETKTVTLTGAEAYGTSGTRYSFTFYDLLAAELRTVVDVAIYEGDTRLSETLRYSAESYAAKNTTGSLATLCKALFAYSDSAKDFFAKEDDAPTPPATTYTVTFKDWDGTVLKTETVESGKSATAPADPTRDGYVFAGWDKAFDNINSDLTVNTIYEQAPIADPTIYHKITYRNLQGAESPTITQFAEHEGLAFEDVPKPIRLGYEFLGWYTASEGGTKVDMIEAGTTKDVTVFAHWELITYTITYKNAAENSNPTTYTIEDEITLVAPEWTGLVFSHWTKNDEAEITKIEQGTTGNIELEANWIYKQNYVISNGGPSYVGGAVDEYGRYSFIYDIGAITNIVLKEQHKYPFSGSEEYRVITTKTHTVGTTEGQEVAKTITGIIHSSKGISNLTSFTKTHEEGWQIGAKWRPEVGVEICEAVGITASALESSGGYSESDTEAFKEANLQSAEYCEIYGTEDEIRTTVNYYQADSTSITMDHLLTPDISPAGTYIWARLMNMRVYAIVTYNPESGNYVLDFYCVPTDIYNGMLYTSVPDELVGKVKISSAELNISITEADIPTMFYTVEYDANGGSGKMPESIHVVGDYSALSPNQFTKTGYHLDGWKTSADGSYADYDDSEKVCDLTAAGKAVTLYAHWEKNTYKVQYNGNKPSIASAFVKNVPGETSCTYDEDVTLGSAPSLTDWTFAGWYKEADCVNRVGDAGEVKQNANLISTQNGTVTLYAKWTKEVTVTLNANGGSVSKSSITVIYGDNSTYSYLPTPTRDGFTFRGWYHGSQKIENDTKVTITTNHTLDARWDLNTNHSVTLRAGNSHSVTVTEDDQVYYHVEPGFDRAELRNNGYTKLEFKILFSGKEIDQGKQHMRIRKARGGTVITTHDFDITTSSAWEGFSFPYTLDLEEQITTSTGDFWLEWGASGSLEDDWELGETTITVTAIK